MLNEPDMGRGDLFRTASVSRRHSQPAHTAGLGVLQGHQGAGVDDLRVEQAEQVDGGS